MELFAKSRPFARLSPANPHAFEFLDQFWLPRRASLKETILPDQYQKIVETGRLENFLRVAGKSQAPFKGYF